MRIEIEPKDYEFLVGRAQYLTAHHPASQVRATSGLTPFEMNLGSVSAIWAVSQKLGIPYSDELKSQGNRYVSLRDANGKTFYIKWTTGDLYFYKPTDFRANYAVLVNPIGSSGRSLRIAGYTTQERFKEFADEKPWGQGGGTRLTMPRSKLLPFGELAQEYRPVHAPPVPQGQPGGPEQRRIETAVHLLRLVGYNPTQARELATGANKGGSLPDDPYQLTAWVIAQNATPAQQAALFPLTGFPPEIVRPLTTLLLLSEALERTETPGAAIWREQMAELVIGIEDFAPVSEILDALGIPDREACFIGTREVDSRVLSFGERIRRAAGSVSGAAGVGT